MPIYDYLCTACDHRADILHGINDPGPNFCPSCGAEGTMRKQFAAPAIHFKGSGWAKKDRASSGSTKASRASSSEPAKESSASGGGEATPAPSAEASKPTPPTTTD
jgi:putative FmdB family regulatory protein